MPDSPVLVATRTPRSPEALVLVLHGGGARQGRTAVSRTQPSVLRMVPVAHRIARAGGGRLAVFRLLNSTRGWDPSHTPVQDACWAVDQLIDRYGDLPVALVGHSLGGRAAVLAAAARPVRGVVALNPWFAGGEHVDLAGRRLLVVHGTEDRVASPARSWQVARSLAPSASSVDYLHVRGGRHAMLRRGRVFEQAAADFVGASVLGYGPAGAPGSSRQGLHERTL